MNLPLAFYWGNRPPFPLGASEGPPDMLCPWESVFFHPIGPLATDPADLNIPRPLVSSFPFPLSYNDCWMLPFPSPFLFIAGICFPPSHWLSCSRTSRFHQLESPPAHIQHSHSLSWIPTSYHVHPLSLLRSQKHMGPTSHDLGLSANHNIPSSGILIPCLSPCPAFPIPSPGGDVSPYTLSHTFHWLSATSVDRFLVQDPSLKGFSIPP